MEALEVFTQEDKQLLRKSWHVLNKNINATAYHIFEMIFAQSPDAKQMFPFMKITNSGTGHNHSKEMEFHALRFMQVLESVINSLDDTKSLNGLCDNLGKIHGRLAEQRGFKPYYWAVFIECTLFHFRKVLSSDGYFHPLAVCDRAIILWRSVLRVLIKRMKVGLTTDLRNRKANRDNEEQTPSEASTISEIVIPGQPANNYLCAHRNSMFARSSECLTGDKLAGQLLSKINGCSIDRDSADISLTNPAQDQFGEWKRGETQREAERILRLPTALSAFHSSTLHQQLSQQQRGQRRMSFVPFII